MKFIKCERRHYDMMFAFYRKVTEHLQNTVNYPEWSEKHPGADGLKDSISNGELYACLSDGKLVGGVVLSEDPEGDYTLGSWKQQLDPGEFVTIHLLAVDPALLGRGIGEYIVDQCIQTAKEKGYKAIRLDAVPENEPAISLYEKKGFTYAGRGDLRSEISGVPEFAMFELNFPVSSSER